MKISIVIPCHNEEKSIRACVESCLSQTRKPDQILVINDGSTDKSGSILSEFGDRVDILTIPRATGNKSRAQEAGLQYVTGEVFIATDGDTKLHPFFVEAIEREFQDPTVAAVSGAVKSLPYNWLTACRAFEYAISHNLHKLAQSYLNFLFVISGAAGAFRTSLFKDYLTFEHDTLTEDLDFTYKLNRLGFRIAYTRDAISYTQDPAKLSGYINQMRRWYGGGWQNLQKHYAVVGRPIKALELSLIYIEGFVFSVFLFAMPFINLYFELWFWAVNIAVNFLVAIWVAIEERRTDVLLVPLFYPIILHINSWVFIEQGIKEVILGRKNLIWFHPDRVSV